MDIVLDGNWDSIERGHRLTARATRIAFLCSGQRAGAIKRDETVQAGIACLDAPKRALNESY
jgi:hypothetical protein